MWTSWAKLRYSLFVLLFFSVTIFGSVEIKANYFVKSINRGRKEGISLTFDDGPHPELTPRVLDVLDEHGARASFFCVGQLVEKHASLVREMAERGHRIENHTWSHPNAFAFLPPVIYNSLSFDRMRTNQIRA